MDTSQICTQHHELVAGICWRVLGNVVDTEDAIQETFLGFFRVAERETIGNPPALLRSIATRTAIAKLRRRKPYANIEESSLSREHPPDSVLEQKELQDRLRTAIASLPSRDSEAFCLRYFEDLSHEEIASSLSIPYAAVTSALYRARKRLSQLLSDLSPLERAE